jgi:hypothetical protein
MKEGAETENISQGDVNWTDQKTNAGGRWSIITNERLMGWALEPVYMSSQPRRTTTVKQDKAKQAGECV